MNCINPLYLIINKINGYIEKRDTKKYEELWNNLQKKHENFCITVIAVRYVLHEVNKYFTSFLDEYFYKLAAMHANKFAK